MKKAFAALGPVLVLGAFALGAPAHGAIINLTPSDMLTSASVTGSSNCESGCIETLFSTSNLTLYYKAEVDEGKEYGSYAGSYSTLFSNSSNDPADALIEYGSGSAISCPSCYLAVKDGNHAPYYYFYDLSAWNGIDSLNLTGFWPNKGAISHVSIWGKLTKPPVTVSEPTSLALLGVGLLGLGLRRRRRRA